MGEIRLAIEAMIVMRYLDIDEKTENGALVVLGLWVSGSSS